MLLRRILALIWLALMIYALGSPLKLFSQDASTGAIRGIVLDSSGARITAASVLVTNQATGLRRGLLTNEEGGFAAQLLPPGNYKVEVHAPGMSALQSGALLVELGSTLELRLTMRVAGAPESVTVTDQSPENVTVSADNANIVDQKTIEDLPLNGRRFSDLALLSPNIVQDPRGLTSDSTGDLASGGIRGYQTSFLVDGADNNNGFFAQARGRYRAPYQFSNEVVQEFRVNTNNYGVELGRAGAAVINVVTRSGSNNFHGKAFYFLRDSMFGATNPFLDFKPSQQQHQFGATLGGPIKRNRAFFYLGYDQHIYHVPTVVRFNDDSAVLTPQPTDYEASDQDLVNLAASALNKMTGTFDSHLIGSAGFAKTDVVLSPRELLTVRVNTSSYSGLNNVYFDPASPITHYAISENGEEDVNAVSAVASLTSGFSSRLTNHLRVQFSRDLQSSSANSSYPQSRVQNVFQGFGRSSILPRNTDENKLHAADTLSFDTHHHSWKFGGDFVLSHVDNYYPLQFGGNYLFYPIRVNPFTFDPETYGMHLTPLRAYAHMVPRYYYQNFGASETQPNGKEYSLFAQDTFRLFSRLGVSLGVRYDLQTFRTDRLVTNPLWPDSGHLFTDTNNIAPRIGLAYAIGDDRPLMIRAGWGIFYTRIPSMYTSEIEMGNGLNRLHTYLDNSNFYDHMVFPTYPNPLVSCPPSTKLCEPPATLAGALTSEISAFSHSFQMPFVQQASLSLEREIASKTTLSISYEYVHGEHLIRARDVNLPKPQVISYPVFDETGTTFTGTYYDVDSFTGWENAASLTCPFPPCIAPVERPISQVGAINVYETVATSIYNGATVSLNRRMSNTLQFRLGYTWGRAVDDAQDTVRAGNAATVQNSYSPQAERALSSIDQRNRFVGAFTWGPRPFHRDQPFLCALFNDWRMSSLVTYGSGRPVNAQITGDANADGNTVNDRLPGYRRNAFTGPDYKTTDLRLSRIIRFTEGFRLELIAEAFNLFNRDNQRFDINDDGFSTTAANFVPTTTTVSSRQYPAHYQVVNGFLKPATAFAPRQVQLALRFLY
ncbi:MAG: TonB-dependent receptor domain-containing protein [Terriglobales bacterium]